MFPLSCYYSKKRNDATPVLITCVKYTCNHWVETSSGGI